MTEKNGLTADINSKESETADAENRLNCEPQDIIHSLIQINRLHRRVVEHWTANLGMHSSGHRMLMYLSRVSSITSQKEIAEHFQISGAAVATTLKKLEADGYIERSKCPKGGDCRSNSIAITERGREAAQATEKYFRYIDIAALNDLSSEDMEMLLSMLKKMRKNLLSIEQMPNVCDTLS